MLLRAISMKKKCQGKNTTFSKCQIIPFKKEIKHN